MTRLRIGFIPLADAAPLLIAAAMGFAEREGLEIEAVREVSWSNVRDKLNIGLFDAAHMLTPMAIASALGIGHVRAPLVAPLVLALNGNAITVSPALHGALMAELDGGEAQPLATAQALARVVRHRRRKGLEPLTFGMTFPFSNHNYQLRFWMAAGGVDPDEDVRLVVLPPPYMAASLGEGQVDGFCAGAPWNSVAVASASASSCISCARFSPAPWRSCSPCALAGPRRTRTCCCAWCAHIAGRPPSSRTRPIARRWRPFSPHPAASMSPPR
jgi:NitT/TauT family transport system ATP-binding protein